MTHNLPMWWKWRARCWLLMVHSWVWYTRVWSRTTQWILFPSRSTTISESWRWNFNLVHCHLLTLWYSDNHSHCMSGIHQFNWFSWESFFTALKVFPQIFQNSVFHSMTTALKHLNYSSGNKSQQVISCQLILHYLWTTNYTIMLGPEQQKTKVLTKTWR